MRLADDAAVEDLRQLQHGFDFVAHHPADRDAGPVRDNGRHRLLVDMGIDHPLLRMDALQRVEFAAQFRALGSRIVAFFRLGQDLADAPDVLDECLLCGPIGFQVVSLSFSAAMSLSIAVMRSLSSTPKIAVADECRFLGFARGNRNACILDQGWRRALADGHARRGGIKQADRLVRQLPCRNIAVGQVDRCDDRSIGDANAVMLFHRTEKSAQHDAAGLDFGFIDLDRLEASGQRGVFLDILAVFCPGGGGDRAQRAAGERRFQQIGRITGAGRAAGADQCMGFIDEQDDRRR